MQLPTEPTILPDARRFPRTFEADTRVNYYAQSVIEIQIPPMDRTYLTKNNYLEFEMDLSYTPGTVAEWTDIVERALTTADDGATEDSLKEGMRLLGQSFFFTNDLTGGTFYYDYSNKASNVLVKPLPFFDTNGPHGLFRKLQVYDFRGTTLLEEIDNYDIITALLHHHERPTFPTDELGIKAPPACSIYDPAEYARQAKTAAPIGIDLTYDEFPWDYTSLAVEAPPVQCATQRYTINLYSFLHSLSQKFVPLHNGFTLRLTVNDPKRCISLATPAAKNTVWVWGEVFEITPQITQFSLKNAKLVTHLLEIPAELDAQVTKEVHARSFHYQLGTTRLQRNLKSLTNLFVQWRPKVQNTEIWAEKLAYRINVGQGKMTYDGAVLKEFKTQEEAYEEAKRLLESTITRSDFFNTSTTPVDQTYGATATQLAAWRDTGRATDVFVGNDVYNTDTRSISLPFRHADELVDGSVQGKYVEAYDLRLPGTSGNAVDGIDTSKAVVEYVGPKNDLAQLELIADFDSFIRVEPGKSTSVAF